MTEKYTLHYLPSGFYENLSGGGGSKFISPMPHSNTIPDVKEVLGMIHAWSQALP